MNDKYHYYKNILQNLPKPLAFLDFDALERNKEALFKRVYPKKVRLATKSVRCLSVIKHLLQNKDIFSGVMTFSGAESIWLSEQGIDNILIGYPVIDPTILKSICQINKAGKQIVCMVDHPQQLNILQKTALEEDVMLPVCLDVDMSVDYPGLHFGVWRSALRNIQDVKQFIQELKSCPNLRLTGLMGYEAQIAGVGDQVAGQGLKNAVVKFLKKSSIRKIAERRKQVYELLLSSGFQPEFVNAGGTGSIESSKQENWVTEITIGSGFYQSHLFDSYSNFKHEPAAMFALEITRNPKQDLFTCHGGGYIASGATDSFKQPQPYLPMGLNLTVNEGAGEVQTPLIYKGNQPLQIGDMVIFRHSKAGELCERFNELYIISEGRIKDIYPTYRGEGKCFL